MTSLTVQFAWNTVGPLALDAAGKLAFPVVQRQPGLYRFLVGTDPEAEVYVGEAVELRRRFQQYRTPGRRQQTNIRVNALLLAHLQSGTSVDIAICTTVGGDIEGESVRLVFADKAVRVLAEHAALIVEREASRVLLNAL